VTPDRRGFHPPSHLLLADAPQDFAEWSGQFVKRGRFRFGSNRQVVLYELLEVLCRSQAESLCAPLDRRQLSCRKSAGMQCRRGHSAILSLENRWSMQIRHCMLRREHGGRPRGAQKFLSAMHLMYLERKITT
jgi:hypothetical protein